MQPIFTGLLTGAGALAYSLWGFWNAYQETKETPEVEKFDLGMTITAIVPTLVLGFMAGYNMTPSSVGDFVGLVVSGFGIAAAQSKLGLKSFFRLEKNG